MAGIAKGCNAYVMDDKGLLGMQAHRQTHSRSSNKAAGGMSGTSHEARKSDAGKTAQLKADQDQVVWSRQPGVMELFEAKQIMFPISVSACLRAVWERRERVTGLPSRRRKETPAGRSTSASTRSSMPFS